MDKEHSEKMSLARAKALKSAQEMTDEEDAAITAAAYADPDNPPLTGAQLSRMRPMSETNPERLARLEAARKAREAAGRVMIGFELDQDVFDHYRSLGGDWDRRINEVLRKAANLPGPAPTDA
jgi:uncharacterized protein (DUF4415 family)